MYVYCVHNIKALSLHFNCIKSPENIRISLNILSIKGTHISHQSKRLMNVTIWLLLQTFSYRPKKQNFTLRESHSKKFGDKVYTQLRFIFYRAIVLALCILGPVFIWNQGPQCPKTDRLWSISSQHPCVKEKKVRKCPVKLSTALYTIK